MGRQPFTEAEFNPWSRSIIDDACRRIDAIGNEYVLNASPTELEDHYIAEITLDPLALHADEKYIEPPRSVRIERSGFGAERVAVPGTQVDVVIPYEGSSALWWIRPSTFSFGGNPAIDVNIERIVLHFCFADSSSAEQQQLKTKIEREVKFIAENVANQRVDVERHNATARDRIRAQLNYKRERALAATNAVSALGIPMKRRDQPATYVIPVRRRPSPVNRPTVPTEKYEAEPALDEAQYQYILRVMRSMSLVVERNPRSFATLREEAVRDHFLLQLNGHYEGFATGETFNRSGKTDILIRVGDRNAFIAECKFWYGQKRLSDAIDQLLSYLTWRDCKCALVVFNRKKDSAGVAAKMHEAMIARPERRRTVAHSDSGECRYIFVKQDEPGREIIITTMLFDVPDA
jgi:hypothetical protein